MPTIVDRHEVKDLVREGARLLEVLPRSEFEREHLVGAESLPLGDLRHDAVARLDRRPIVVYCYDSL